MSIFLAFAASAVAQPAVTAVVNAASNALQGLPNAAIAEGAMFVAYGTNMGPAAIMQANSFPLPANLGGTSAKITVNGTSVDAIMIYTLASQIAAVLPSSTPVGTGTITVTYNNQTSAPAPITVVKNNFGTFAVNQAGSGAGIVTFSDYSLVTVSKAANPGETLLVWGTGLGPVSGNEAGGPLPGDKPDTPVELYVGGQQASLTYRGRSGCCTGLDQIAFVVPQGLSGCSVPVAVKINDEVSNFTTMSIAPSGRVCSDANGLTGTDLQDLFNKPVVSIGTVSLSRTNSQSTGFMGVGGGTTKEDDGSAGFFKLTVPAGGFPTSFAQSVSFGACSVSTFSGQSVNPFPGITIQSLDAGDSIGVSGPSGNRTLAKTQAGGFTAYSAKLGDTTPGNYLDAGTYTITGPGGPDVPGFSTTLTLPQPLVWTNQDSIAAVTRASGLQVTWNGGDPKDFVDITGSNFAVLAGNKFVSASFSCRARTSDGSFTVPPVVLLSLPASSATGGVTIPGNLGVGSLSSKLLSIPGLDYAAVASSVSNSKQVSYQ